MADRKAPRFFVESIVYDTNKEPRHRQSIAQIDPAVGKSQIVFVITTRPTMRSRIAFAFSTEPTLALCQWTK